MGLLAWSASAQNWTVGGRIGSGFQAVGQYVFSNDNYVEARFGAYWANAGVSSRCMPLKQSGTVGKCPVCGKECTTDIYWGVAY